VPGPKRLYHRAKDAAGNWGAIAITDFSTSLPAGFDFESAGADDFTAGALVNTGVIAIPGKPRYLYMLMLQETWAQHMAQYTPRTMRAKELAGQAIHSKPGAAEASYERTYDAGKIIATANLQFSRQTEWRHGTGTLTPILLHKLAAGDPWTQITNTWAAQISNFRYFGIRINAAASPVGAKLIVQSLSYQLSTQIADEAGSITCFASDALGTLYECKKPFIDITSVQVTTSADGTWATYTSDDTVNPPVVRIKIWRIVAGSEVRQNGTVSFNVKGLI
jgi:hypothetical protein